MRPQLWSNSIVKQHCQKAGSWLKIVRTFKLGSIAHQFMVEYTKKNLEVIGGWEVGAATTPPAKSVVVVDVFIIDLGIHSFICLFTHQCVFKRNLSEKSHNSGFLCIFV